MSRAWITALAWIAAVELMTLVGLCVVELALRLARWIERRVNPPVRRQDFLAPGYQDYINWVEDWSKPMFQYLPVGFRHFNLKNGIPGRVRHNSLGFRCDELAAPADALRIVLLGGSAAWGSGAASNETTITGWLERIVNDDGRLLAPGQRAVCYNLAQVNGYQTQDLLNALFFAPRIQPTIVLSFTGWNELMANDGMTRELLERYRVFYLQEMEGWEPLGVANNRATHLRMALRGWASQRFELSRRLLGARRRLSAAPAEDPVARIALGSELFLEHLVSLQHLAAGFGFLHLQFLQPYLYRKRPLTPQEAKVIELYDHVRPVHGGQATGDYLRQHPIYAALLQAIAHTAAPVGPVIDLCDEFRDEPAAMFYTLVHLTDAGYRRIAERMYDAMRQWYPAWRESAPSAQGGPSRENLMGAAGPVVG